MDCKGADPVAMHSMVYSFLLVLVANYLLLGLIHVPCLT